MRPIRLRPTCSPPLGPCRRRRPPSPGRGLSRPHRRRLRRLRPRSRLRRALLPVPTYAHLEPPAVRRPPAGAPAVRLSFLLYSPAPGRRTVALAIENRGLETLHEGEASSDGVEVVRILPDRVELGWNGEHFTVRARD